MGGGFSLRHCNPWLKNVRLATRVVIWLKMETGDFSAEIHFKLAVKDIFLPSNIYQDISNVPAVCVLVVQN